MTTADSPVVLLVDSHADSLAMYSLGLLAMGFQPLTAEDADTGLARARQTHPDVIVADLTPTRISGFEFIRRLRGDAQTQNVGIIVLSGHRSASLQAEASEAGCDRFLTKPCMPDELAVHIRDVIVSRHSSGD